MWFYNTQRTLYTSSSAIVGTKTVFQTNWHKFKLLHGFVCILMSHELLGWEIIQRGISQSAELAVFKGDHIYLQNSELINKYFFFSFFFARGVTALNVVKQLFREEYIIIHYFIVSVKFPQRDLAFTLILQTEPELPSLSLPCLISLSPHLSHFLILLSYSAAKNCSYFKHFTSGEEAEVFEVKTQKGWCHLTAT